jgi:hypothetical protein
MGGALTKSSPTRRFPSLLGLGSDATVFSMRFTGLCHQGHPASRKYSGSKPGAATLRVVAQSSRTVSFRYRLTVPISDKCLVLSNT